MVDVLYSFSFFVLLDFINLVVVNLGDVRSRNNEQITGSFTLYSCLKLSMTASTNFSCVTESSYCCKFRTGDLTEAIPLVCIVSCKVRN